MKKLLIPFLILTTLAGLQAADLTAPNANLGWTNDNAWSGTTWNSTTPDNARFGDISSDRTATNVSAITAGNIAFSNTANRWTVSGSGGQITLNGVLSKTNAGNVTISANTLLTGAGSVQIDGGELQLLNNGNNFSGGITLNSGTLRVGNGNGTGSPQTAGSLGTGTFSINGGTIFQNQGNVRSQAVAAVIGGSFALNSVAGGGLILGSDGTGTRTVSLGGASRTITVSESSDGTGANAFLGLRDLTSSAGGAIVKEGAGVLRIQGTSTAPVTANAGAVEITGGLGATTFTMNSGTVWRKSTATALGAGGTMNLNNASLVNNDTLANTRNSAFGTFQISGTNSVFVGSGLTIQEGTSTTGGITVRSNGVFGGNGRLQTATNQSYSAGVTTLSDIGDSSITLSAGGSIRPGTPDSLNSTIGTLAFGNLTWNGEGTNIAQIAMNLGTGTNSDRINLSGTLTKGTGSNFVFDFLNFSATSITTYTLLTFNSQSGFAVGDFTSTNISFASGLSGQFSLNSGNLQFSVIPEPSTIAAAVGLLGLLGWPIARRRLQSR